MLWTWFLLDGWLIYLVQNPLYDATSLKSSKSHHSYKKVFENQGPWYDLVLVRPCTYTTVIFCHQNEEQSHRYIVLIRPCTSENVQGWTNTNSVLSRTSVSRHSTIKWYLGPLSRFEKLNTKLIKVSTRHIRTSLISFTQWFFFILSLLGDC